MSRIYNLQYQAMKKDIDKYFEENKEEVNKSFLNRGCRITVKVDRLECYHSNSTPMNLEDFSNRYFEPKGKSSNDCLLYTSPSPRDLSTSRMPSSA